MARPLRLLAVSLAAVAASPAGAQEFFRCTSPEGKVIYQEAPCPPTHEGRRIDATPANTDYDPDKRERLLRQGEEAGKRLEERAAREREEARLRQEAREREERLEREAQAREAARDAPVYILWPPAGPGKPPPLRPVVPPRPQPRPAPNPPGR